MLNQNPLSQASTTTHYNFTQNHGIFSGQTLLTIIFTQKILGITLPTGQYWIDGFRKTPTEAFKYIDNTPINATWLSGAAGNCVSLVANGVTVSWHKTPCQDALPGYICQYAATN